MLPYAYRISLRVDLLSPYAMCLTRRIIWHNQTFRLKVERYNILQHKLKICKIMELLK